MVGQQVCCEVFNRRICSIYTYRDDGWVDERDTIEVKPEASDRRWELRRHLEIQSAQDPTSSHQPSTWPGHVEGQNPKSSIELSPC